MFLKSITIKKNLNIKELELNLNITILNIMLDMVRNRSKFHKGANSFTLIQQKIIYKWICKLNMLPKAKCHAPFCYNLHSVELELLKKINLLLIFRRNNSAQRIISLISEWDFFTDHFKILFEDDFFFV